MISERELRRIAARAGIGVGQTEHEYVLLCALDALSQTEIMADTFCLKGGTALRLVYFSDWRHSVDLDFSVLPTFPAELLRSLVENWFTQVYVMHDVEIHLSDFHRVNGAARMRAQFVGPLHHPARLLFDITLDEPILLAPERRPALTSFFPKLCPSVLTYTLEEILAEKMRSIIQRGKARDYYDVWRLLKEKKDALDMSRVCTTLFLKCRHIGLLMPSKEAFIIPERLEEARIYWQRDLAGQVSGPFLPQWDVVVKELAEALDTFFSECAFPSGESMA